MAVVAAKKPRAGTANNGKGTTVLCLALVVGACIIRIFVLPARNALPKLKSLEIKTLYSGMVHATRPQRSLIPLDPEGTMANDILSIEHLPEDLSIVVTLKHDGRCPNPFLRGRLSGPALVILEWSSNGNARHVGSYRVPLSGTYFVEIIAIVCQDYSGWMDFDFQRTCVEAPLNHRLTKSNVKIDVNKNQAAFTTSNQQPALGYWIHQSDERAANNDYSAMYTRFQPRGCLRLNDPTHEHFHMPPKHCIEPTDWNRFESYTQFRYYEPDGSSKLNFPSSAKVIQAPHPTTLCLVGGSHSRTLRASMENYHNFSMTNNNLQIEWINAKFPRNVPNQTIVNDIAGKCHKIVLAVGQWPASFSGNKPTLFQTYKKEMDKLFGRLQAHLPASTEIWARSIHENPLNERIAAYCPPKDWRSPTTIEGYNTVIRRAVADARPNTIRFVDTSFIVTPLWDASTDWGHVCPQASHAEALYLVAVVMGLVNP